MSDLGIVIPGRMQNGLDVREVIDLEPDAVLVDVETIKDLIWLERLRQAPFPVYPMLHPTSGPTILANIINQAFLLRDPMPIYFSLTLSNLTLMNLRETLEILDVTYNRTIPVLYLCGVATHFLYGDRIGILGLEEVRNRVQAHPCFVMSDSPDAQRIWENLDFLRLLHAFPGAQFQVISISEEQFDYSVITNWERTTFFRSIPVYLDIRRSQKNKVQEVPEDYQVTGRANVDRLTAYAEEKLRTPVRKLAKGEKVTIKDFLGKVVLTTKGDYIAKSSLDLDE